MRIIGRLKNYAFALAVVAIGFLLRLLIDRLTGSEAPAFITFYPAVMIAALLWGLRAGVFATVAADLVVWYFIFPVKGSFAFEIAGDVADLALFLAMGVFMSIVADRYRRLRHGLEDAVADRTARLADSNRQLQQEIAERKAAEEERKRLLEQLENKNKELQNIVYVASHDLRSPLVNIYGFSGQLAELWQKLGRIIEESADIGDVRDKTRDLLANEMPEYVNFIKAGAEKMQMVINGLLTMSRLGTVPLKMERLNMDDIFEHIVKSIAFEAKQKGAEINVRPLPPCTGDKTQIHQLFSNIVTNAIKYLDPNRPGRIHVTSRQEGDMNIYTVCDNGIGIAEDHKEKIFEIFHRLNPKDGVSGEGLGLSIVLRIADRHNGRVWVDSTPGKGSAFHVALPQ